MAYLIYVIVSIYYLPRRIFREPVQLTAIPFSDYINPIDLCNRLNTYIIPEAAVQGFLTFLFLINGYWMALILNLPLLVWNIKKCVAPKLPQAVHVSLCCGY